MRFLLDTKVISELRRPHAADAVRRWVRAQPVAMLANHRHHVMELEIGIRRAERRDPTRVRCWGSGSNSVWSRPFPKESRPLEVARRASELLVPDPGPQRDTLIAATALVHGLAMMTRNVADFLPTGVPLLDRWAT